MATLMIWRDFLVSKTGIQDKKSIKTGGERTHVGVELADERREVVVLEVQREEVAGELSGSPHDETAERGQGVGVR